MASRGFILWSFVWSFVWSCSAAPAGCPSGTRLVGDTCRPVCASSTECLADEGCLDGVCLPGVPPESPDAGKKPPKDDDAGPPAAPDDASTPPECEHDVDCGPDRVDESAQCLFAGVCPDHGTRTIMTFKHACDHGMCRESAGNPSDAPCQRPAIADGTHCEAGFCCHGSCLSPANRESCGACGINCGSNGTCVQYGDHFACGCSTDLGECPTFGYGARVSCSLNGTGARLVCQCGCPAGDTQCTGTCGSNGGVCTKGSVTVASWCGYP